MAVRDKAWFPILYMFVLTLVLSAVIILFGSLTRQRVQNNELIAFERAVLQSLDIKEKGFASPSEIHRAYVELIRQPDDSSAGAYRLIKGDSTIAYALPLSGPGFWALIKGVIGIKADRITVTGIAFYEQNETPGLGAEIAKREFTDQFVGKALSPGNIPLNIVPLTASLDDHSVHAVTGATQTSNRVATLVNEALRAWREQMAGETE